MNRLIALFVFLSIGAGLNGQTYFQQDVAYQIRVQLDDKSMTLTGDEEVVYTNNSPDTLSFIYFHLWPNAYKNTKTAMAKQLRNMGNTAMFFATEDELGYIDSISFALDGKLCLWELDPENIDICKIFLEKPLNPGEFVQISTPFRVKIPSGNISRLGHIDESFQITQWYPKPAVYDSAGWHQMPYLTQGEFYSEFGSYDVFITLPENYVVGATGDLKTESEISWLNEMVAETEVWLEERKQDQDGKTTNKDLSFPASREKLKTLHYHQDKVHDFAWFADKRYHVLKGKVALPASGDSVDVWTMFTNKRAHLWQNSIEYMKDAIYYYSIWNGDYPYQQATAVDGTISAGGGMEYPNVTVIGDAGDALSLETVIMHEVGHNWFYGILGSNERQFPWMDEGLNSYNEQRYLSTKYPNGSILSKDTAGKLLHFVGLNNYGIGEVHELSHLIVARTNRVQPLNIPAEDYSSLNYGFIVYSKSAVTFNYLRHYLGDSTMDAAMHQYFEANKFKHPYPKSVQMALESTSGQNLDWFFDVIMSTTGKIDYKIKKVSFTNDSTIIKLKNRGLTVPVQLSLFDENAKVLDSIWVEGFETDTTFRVKGVASNVVIDPNRIMPELIRDNNYFDKSRLLKKVEPLSFKFIGGVELPWKNQIFYSPILGMNVPNGFMPGLLLYNHSIPARKFTYALAPMLATKGNKLVGTGVLSYSIHPYQASFETIEVSLGGKRYIESRISGQEIVYNRLNPSVTFYLKPRHYDGLIDQNFRIGSLINYRQQPTKRAPGVWSQNLIREVINRVDYRFNYGHPIFKTRMLARLEQSNQFVRTFFEMRETLALSKKLKLDLRYFAGAFLANNTTKAAYNWRMDGQSTTTDYAYDGEYFDRSGTDEFLSRQFSENHGGFKVPTAIGQSSRGLTALNAKLKLKKFPIGLFGDVGYSISSGVVWDGGIYVPVLPGIIEVYLPLTYSSSIKTEIAVNGKKWFDLIRFQIALDRINPVESVKRFNFL